jgi:hypothetical protein
MLAPLGVWWLLVGCARIVAAQSAPAADGWNDARALALVELATRRRAEQLADTGLVDYRATARGYVTFLVSMGSGFLEAPKVVKTDQLALEVYWHAPNQSKQRIIGRRDTLLFPTDIQYHRDHLGIVQNNFPDFIRIGDGDEVSDVPHPLSRLGLSLYDFRITGDSVRIRLPDRTIDLIEVKVRPKDDHEARIIGAIYLDPSGGQVVRMAFSFTRAALLDKDLEDLAIVLENRLVGGRFWLPSEQQIEIRRTGTYLEFPVRGIIRGRWEVGDYDLNVSVPTTIFAGPEIVSASPQELKKYPWQGTIMDSLPPDVRATVDPDIKNVLDEARGLVREQALQRLQAARLSAPQVSDFVRMNRVEGVAVGGGVSSHLASTLFATARVRYGIDDKLFMGSADLHWEQPSGSELGAFLVSDLADIGDQPERSVLVNSLAAQEFGSDLTDPYLARGGGVRARLRQSLWQLDLSAAGVRELEVGVSAIPTIGRFEGAPAILRLEGPRLRASAYRAQAPWRGPGSLAIRIAATAVQAAYLPSGSAPGWTRVSSGPRSFRASVILTDRVDFAGASVWLTEQAGAAHLSRGEIRQDLVYFGGPVSAPGYDLHSLVGSSGSSTRAELQLPVPFIPVPLGRFGVIPGRGRLAPFANFVVVNGSSPLPMPGRPPELLDGIYPSFGVGLITFFDALRFDLARGTNHGRWIFNVDVSREFWSIL